MNIIIKKRFLLYKGFKIKCSIGKLGLSKFKREGDLTTPIGVFKLGLLYYRKDRNNKLKCNIKKKVSFNTTEGGISRVPQQYSGE